MYDAPGAVMPPTTLDFIRDQLSDIKGWLDRIEAKVDKYDPERCASHAVAVRELQDAEARRAGASAVVGVGWARIVAVAAILSALMACGSLAVAYSAYEMRKQPEVSSHAEVAQPR